MARKLLTIGFDADDTLWHNERFFALTQERVAALLADYAERDHLDARLLEAERRNLGHYGFGVKGFVLSMIETAVEVTEGRVPGHVVGQILEAGQKLLAHPLELLPHAREAVEAVADSHHLLLITKGDLLHQEQKLASSGLGDYFVAVEIVSEKDAGTYRRVFERYGTGAEQAVMAGNSMKSDILPALEAGCWSALIPYPLVWAHEAAEAPVGHERYVELGSISELPGWVDGLSRQAK